jgi:hypothetical protein
LQNRELRIEAGDCQIATLMPFLKVTLPAVERLSSRNDVEERCFSGTIRSIKADFVAFGYAEGNVAKQHSFSETFAEAVDLQNGSWHERISIFDKITQKIAKLKMLSSIWELGNRKKSRESSISKLPFQISKNIGAMISVDLFRIRTNHIAIE